MTSTANRSPLRAVANVKTPHSTTLVPWEQISIQQISASLVGPGSRRLRWQYRPPLLLQPLFAYPGGQRRGWDRRKDQHLLGLPSWDTPK